ncbi:MAG: putative quinol monooxygenase [Pseudomonadota bacterium]
MYAVTVTFSLEPGRSDVFLPLMMKNARASAANEPGCLLFDVCVDDEDPNTIFLYELYKDRAAFDAHRQMPHYAEFNAAIEGLVAGKEVRRFSNVMR